jgi:hypothetical protein
MHRKHQLIQLDNVHIVLKTTERPFLGTCSSAKGWRAAVFTHAGDLIYECDVYHSTMMEALRDLPIHSSGEVDDHLNQYMNEQ